MKRSEMLAQLKEETDNWMNPCPTEYELDSILSVLERAGMLPPTIELPLQYRNGKQLLAKTANQWESEDE